MLEPLVPGLFPLDALGWLERGLILALSVRFEDGRCGFPKLERRDRLLHVVMLDEGHDFAGRGLGLL